MLINPLCLDCICRIPKFFYATRGEQQAPININTKDVAAILAKTGTIKMFCIRNNIFSPIGQKEYIVLAWKHGYRAKPL